jgi:hypothetical protein
MNYADWIEMAKRFPAAFMDEQYPAGHRASALAEGLMHRALLAKTDVYATPSHGGYTVQVRDLDFEAPTLIEAYAMALEWLK